MEKLNIQDRDSIGTMFIVAVHMAERWLSMVEMSYLHEYQESEDYRQLVKRYGKTQADQICGSQCRRIIRQDEKMQINRLLKAAKDFHLAMERVSQHAIDHGTRDLCTNFDDLQDDVALMTYIQALIRNIEESDDILRIISTLKLYGKQRENVSQRIMDRITEPMKL